MFPLSSLDFFRDRNAPLVLFGRLAVFMGDVTQDLSLIWIVWEMTHSSAATSLASMAGRIPLWLFSLPAGVYADASEPRRTMVLANVACSIIALAAFLLGVSGHLGVPVLCLFAFAISTCRTFEAPVFYSLVRGLARDSATRQLNGVADTAKRSARLLAPLLANAVRQVASALSLYGLISVFYAFMALAGLRMRMQEQPATRLPRKGFVADLRQAARVIRQTPTLRFIVLAEFLFNAAYGACYYVFLPRLTMDTAGGGALGYAAAVTAFGVGGLVAGVLATGLNVPGHSLAFAMVGWLGMGLSFGLMCLTAKLWIIVALTACAGAAMSIQTIALWSALHDECPSELSGRVYSIWRLGADGALTVSTLAAGVVTDMFGPSRPIGVVGVYVFAAILLARRFALRTSGPREVSVPT